MPAIRHDLRNIAIVAHVDHGKTTLVDELRQSGVFRANQEVVDRVLTRWTWNGRRASPSWPSRRRWSSLQVRINVVDTCHADFGGEVERTCGWSTPSCCWSTQRGAAAPDPLRARQGPPAAAAGGGLRQQGRPLRRRPAEVVHEIEELFLDLDADEDQIGFPILYANARTGRAGHRPDELAGDLGPAGDDRGHHPATVL